MESGFFSGLNFVLAGALFNHSACTNNHPLYYGVQYVHRGRFYLSVNNGPVYNLEGPALFLTDPEMFFSYGSPPGTFREHYYICANGERMSRYIESGLFPLAAKQEQPYYKVLHPNVFLSEMMNLIMPINNGGDYDLTVCRYEHLLLSIRNLKQQTAESELYRTELEQLTQKIVKEPEKNWDFRAFARKLNISEKHFLRIFGRRYGVSPHHFMLQQRISKACSLLLLTKEPLKSIADECGFSNPFYFSRLIKKYMRVNPDFYRKNH